MRIESKARRGAFVSKCSAQYGSGVSRVVLLVKLYGYRQLEVKIFDQVRVPISLLNFEPFSQPERQYVLKTIGLNKKTKQTLQSECETKRRSTALTTEEQVANRSQAQPTEGPGRKQRF